ncbi:MAG: hypothetical protein HOV79_00475 [Hamadaea sp.]|nr:hypothetical protein [Hamadaea sp.]
MTTYAPPPRRRIPLAAIAAVAVVVLAGAGLLIGVLLGNDSRESTPDRSAVPAADRSFYDAVMAQASAEAAMPKCADLFQPGKIIDDLKGRNGCKDPDGSIVWTGWGRCDDGRHLFTVDASSGAPEGWGFGGDVFHAGKTPGDKGFSRDYKACNGS